jgi:hypothetical protein
MPSEDIEHLFRVIPILSVKVGHVEMSVPITCCEDCSTVIPMGTSTRSQPYVTDAGSFTFLGRKEEAHITDCQNKLEQDI